MNVRELDDIAAEVRRLAGHFERQRRGSGVRFFDSYDNVLLTLARFPQFYPLVEDDCPPHEVRNAVLDPFDYRVIHFVRPTEVVIFAVAHTGRRPGHWHRRLADPAL